MIADKVPFKLEPVVMPGPVTVDDIRGKPQFDLAVVRGNMKLSNDWPVVAILRDDVVALMVPPASALQTGRSACQGQGCAEGSQARENRRHRRLSPASALPSSATPTADRNCLM